MTSFDLLVALKKLNLLDSHDRANLTWWWPNALSFEVVVGAILTQNTKWEAVEKSLQNLKATKILDSSDEVSLNNLANAKSIESSIIPSGFYRQKSSRLIALAKAIKKDFGNFKNFKDSCDTEWLLAQKGIGLESAYGILNYACGKEVMVVDKYTYKLLCALGIEISEYEDLRAFCQRGIYENEDLVLELYKPSGIENLAQIFARFHGKIVEFSKNKLDINLLKAKVF